MAIDFNKPVVTDNYSTALLPNLVNSIKALGQMLDPAVAGTLTNTPTGAHRLNSATGIFEFFNGTTWAERVLSYAKLSGATFTGAVSGITDLTTTGNAILGNAQGDTLNVGNGDIIKDASGRTGFGVSPSAKAHVKSLNEILRLETTVARGSGSAYLQFNDPTGQKGAIGYTGAADDILRIWNTLNASIVMAVNNTVAATLSTSGLTLAGALSATSLAGSGAGITSLPWASLTGVSAASPTFSAITAGSVVASTGNGHINLIPAGTAQTGYLEFIANNGNRQGYIGFSSTTGAGDGGTIPYVAGFHEFTGSVRSSSVLLGNGGSKGYGAITTTTTTGTPTGGASGDFVLVY